MNKKKALALFTTAAVSCGLFAASFSGVVGEEVTVAAATGEYNYASALQMSLFFYECQQAGPIADWNRVTWRADSTMNDEVLGGWYDAGDHMKFTLPMAYSCAMMAWGLYEYPDGVEAVGEMQNYINNLEFGLDYVAACDYGDEVVYQIGDGGADHVWWGPAEIYDYKISSRPTYTCTASSVTGEMAAALAAGAVALEGLTDKSKTDSYLEHAINCFEIADTTRNNDDYDCSYYKLSHFYDELFWAANWLYLATGEQTYLDKATSYIGSLSKESQSEELCYTWGHCWDDVMQGGMLLYAINTGDTTYKTQVSKHLDYWTVGYGGKAVTYTPDGLAWLTNWGAIRHATTTAFLAEVAVKELFADDATLSTRYTEFAESQLNYCLGDNSNNFSYVIGYSENCPQHYHHRTANASWNDLWQENGVDKPHRHTLYGAIVGGPNSQDVYTDVISSYENSEVATDYNAGYTALLCAMVEEYGGETDASFPPIETPDGDEFYMEACINQANTNFTEIKALATNHSAWPARVITDLSYRYYFDISELVENGYSIADVTVKIGYDEHGTTQISEPVLYDGTVYYVEITYPDGSVIRPSGQSEHQAELQFRISAPDGTSCWDPTNDYSYAGLESGNENIAVTSHITMYDAGVLIYGTEPDGTVPATTTASSEIGTTTTTDTQLIVSLLGDVNVDSAVTIADIIMLNRYLVLAEELSAQGAVNADMDADTVVDVFDAVMLKKVFVSGAN